MREAITCFIGRVSCLMGRALIISFVVAGALLVLLFLMTFLFMFEGLAYEDKLVEGYVVQAADTRNDAAICRTDAGQVIPAMVVAYGWNDDFILAERHPSLDGRKPNLYVTHWYLIEVHSAKVHGPLTEQQFTGLRHELGVPEELTFTKTIHPD